MRRAFPTVLAACIGLALTSLAPAAFASKTFPEALRKNLGLAQIAGSGMGCQLCHQDDVGGLKTATKPFGRSLSKAGVMGANVPSLLGGLATLDADGTDSDGDGTPDISELEAEQDPNVGASGMPAFDDVPLPETGCTLTPQSPRRGAWGLLAVGLLALGRRRRSKQLRGWQ